MTLRKKFSPESKIVVPILIQGLIFSQSFSPFLGATLGRQEHPSEGVPPPAEVLGCKAFIATYFLLKFKSQSDI